MMIHLGDTARDLSQVEPVFCGADRADATHAIAIDFMSLVRKVPCQNI